MRFTYKSEDNKVEWMLRLNEWMNEWIYLVPQFYKSKWKAKPHIIELL